MAFAERLFPKKNAIKCLAVNDIAQGLQTFKNGHLNRDEDTSARDSMFT